jgi:hypothetical protein
MERRDSASKGISRMRSFICNCIHLIRIHTMHATRMTCIMYADRHENENPQKHIIIIIIIIIIAHTHTHTHTDTLSQDHIKPWCTKYGEISHARAARKDPRANDFFLLIVRASVCEYAEYKNKEINHDACQKSPKQQQSIQQLKVG